MSCHASDKIKFKFELKFKFKFDFASSLFVLDGTELKCNERNKTNNTAGLLDGPDGETRTGATPFIYAHRQR